MTAIPTYEKLERRVRELEQEIEKRIQAETTLWESEYQARQYLSVVRALIVALDTKGNITLVNEYALETLGYKREELLGKNWFTICLAGGDRDDVLPVYHQLIRGEIAPVEYYENSVLRKDGAERIVERECRKSH